MLHKQGWELNLGCVGVKASTLSTLLPTVHGWHGPSVSNCMVTPLSEEVIGMQGFLCAAHSLLAGYIRFNWFSSWKVSFGQSTSKKKKQTESSWKNQDILTLVSWYCLRLPLYSSSPVLHSLSHLCVHLRRKTRARPGARGLSYSPLDRLSFRDWVPVKWWRRSWEALKQGDPTSNIFITRSATQLLYYCLGINFGLRHI